MSCRQWLSSAARQGQSALAQQQRQTLSTSAAVQAGLKPIKPLFPQKDKKARANANSALHEMLVEGLERGAPLSREEQQRVLDQQPKSHLRDLRSHAITDNYMRQMPRRWRNGDVYSPRDLGPGEMQRWRQGRPPARDVLDIFGFNPLDNYKNFALVSEYITTMGRIRHSSDTALRPVNQRKMAKAVRRAIGMGLHPSVHKHPEILRRNKYGVPGSLAPMSSNSSQNRL